MRPTNGGQVQRDLLAALFERQDLSYDDMPLLRLKKGTPMETRTDRFPGEGGLPIPASVPGYSVIPFLSERLTLIGLSWNDADGNQAIYAKTTAEKRKLTFTHDTILIAWPGRSTMDIFVVDDIDAARRALGLRMAGDDVLTDASGREWRIQDNEL